MATRKESEFAEVLVDRLFLESFSTERSAYHRDNPAPRSSSWDKNRKRLKWHISRSLSPRQKQVIQHYLSGKKEREIASILGITQQVVNIYKHRAIKRLGVLMAAGGVCQKAT
jgi:RNA polymerase sigma factor (sigma-70 family)